MSLAARIDRLRGQVAPTGSASGTASAPDTSARSRDMAALGEILGAEPVAGDLLVREREYTLPADAQQPIDLCALPEVYHLSKPDWVYLDTETTGLSGGAGNLAFLVGVARYVGAGTLRVRQYLLGSYAAEVHMLRDLIDWIGGRAVLVTYNGKCFDLPLLIARCRMQRVAQALDQRPHLDLMYSVRRAFRRHWPDCRLQTAERYLLRLERDDDLPGAQVPGAWQHWLRAGESTLLAAALRHNWQDVISLALLQRGLIGPYGASAHPVLDAAAVARAWRMAGCEDRAREALEGAYRRLDASGQLQLAALYRRQGDWTRAKAMWLALHARGDARAACELSKYYEHRRRDYARASDYALHCVPAERAVRLGRLRRKSAPVYQLPLWAPGLSRTMSPAEQSLHRKLQSAREKITDQG